MLLTDYACTFAVQLFYMFTISGLERSKHSDITWLRLVGCVRRKAAQNDVVLVTKLHHFEGFMRPGSIIYQDPRPMVCAAVKQEAEGDPGVRPKTLRKTKGDLADW